MKIILVEDNPVTSMSLSLFFQDNKYKVLESLSYAEDVFPSVEKHAPELIVLDIMLKGKKSGLDVAEELRKSNIQTPILFVSALTDANTMSRIKDIAACDYVTKPYDYEKLVFKIEALTESS